MNVELFFSYARTRIIDCPEQRSIVAGLSDLEILKAVDYAWRAKNDSDYITISGVLQEWHDLPDPDGGMILNDDVCQRLDSMETLDSWIAENHSITQYKLNTKGRLMLSKRQAA